MTTLAILCALCTVFITGPATVIDGDTVRVGPVAIRLKGIDAAEHDAEATSQLRQIIGTDILTCTLTGEKTWNRVVGYCVTSYDIDIGRRLIETGHALACPRYDPRYLRFEPTPPPPASTPPRARARYCSVPPY